ILAAESCLGVDDWALLCRPGMVVLCLLVARVPGPKPRLRFINDWIYSLDSVRFRCFGQRSWGLHFGPRRTPFWLSDRGAQDRYGLWFGTDAFGNTCLFGGEQQHGNRVHLRCLIWVFGLGSQFAKFDCRPFPFSRGGTGDWFGW